MYKLPLTIPELVAQKLIDVPDGQYDIRATEQREIWVNDKCIKVIWKTSIDVNSFINPWGTYPDLP